MDPKDAMEQYKALIGDLGNVGGRYATANAFYLSVVTALLGVIALSESGKALAQVNHLLLLTVSAFALVICYIWAKTVEFYGALFGAKFRVLKEMESVLPFKAYELEFKYLNETGVGGLTRNEILVPRILGGFFALLALFSVCL